MWKGLQELPDLRRWYAEERQRVRWQYPGNVVLRLGPALSAENCSRQVTDLSGRPGSHKSFAPDHGQIALWRICEWCTRPKDDHYIASLNFKRYKYAPRKSIPWLFLGVFLDQLYRNKPAHPPLQSITLDLGYVKADSRFERRNSIQASQVVTLQSGLEVCETGVYLIWAPDGSSGQFRLIFLPRRGIRESKRHRRVNTCLFVSEEMKSCLENLINGAVTRLLHNVFLSKVKWQWRDHQHFASCEGWWLDGRPSPLGGAVWMKIQGPSAGGFLLPQSVPVDTSRPVNTLAGANTSDSLVKVLVFSLSTSGVHNVTQSSCLKYRIRFRNADDSVT